MAIVERLFSELGQTEVAVATVQLCLLERGRIILPKATGSGVNVLIVNPFTPEPCVSAHVDPPPLYWFVIISFNSP